MTVWRITGGEDGVESGGRASPAHGPGYDLVELDTALLRIVAATAAPRLAMSGEIDVSNAGDVTRALDTAQRRVAGDVHVDLTEVDFVDVAGLRAFTLAARDLREGDRLLVLHSVSPHIDKLFATIGWSTTPGLEIHCRHRG
ncbi:STAS domain-containing protein [Actinomadura sp. 9N215]|uniref:STAS domain-containing protein n=1 Tax=Actinomadura sp. 9N215 TaxID=3375150 RepID=UPI0037B1D070